MSLKLYEIDQAIRGILDAGEFIDEVTGEFWDEQDLDKLEMDKAAKVLSCAKWVKERESMAKAIREEEKALAERRKSIEAGVGRAKDFLGRFVDAGEKFEDSQAKVSTRKKPESVGVLVPLEDLPERFKRVKVDADRKSLKDALKAGEDLSGVAELVDGGHSVVVK